MRILVFSQYYEPEPFIIHDKFKELVNKGYKVTVITGLPNYPSGEVFKGYHSGTYMVDGVEIIRTNIRPRKKGEKNLFLNYLSYVKNGIKEIKKINAHYDIIYVYQLSPIFMAIPAILYKIKFKVPLVIYCLDLWPASIVSGGIIKDSIIYKIIEFISKLIYKQADSLHISSREFETYFKEELKIKNVFIYNPQYHIENIQTKLNETEAFMDPEKINLTFTGNVGEIQGLDTVIKSLVNLDSHVVLNIVGDGSKVDELKKLSNELSLSKRVIFHGRKPLEDISMYYEKSDALIVSMKKDRFLSYTLPAKIQSYLQSGKFIIGSVDGEAAKIISESKAGIVSKAGDYTELAENITKFLRDMNSYKIQGKNGPIFYKKNFGKEKFIKIITDDFERLIEKK